MVSIASTSPYTAYASYNPYASGSATAKSGATTTDTKSATATDTVTLSDEAKSALATKDFATVLAEARTKLSALLTDAGRTSPLKNQQLAVDLSSLDHRELYAISSDKSFSADERDAAGLEMQRRLEAALAGPAAIARVTGDYTGLYKAAATYLDALGPEERASADWQAGRDAVTEGLKQLKTKPGNLPDAGKSDPVALYLALGEKTDTSTGASLETLSSNARTTLDRLYAQAKANGKLPTFNRQTTTGTFIDVSNFSSRTLSAIVLDSENHFSAQEVSAARTALHQKSSATLLSGFQAAAKSSDPTAFSQNVIAAYSSLSADERRAAGWSENLYQSALQSYASTSKLMSLFSQATTSAGTTPSLATLLGS